MSESTIPVSKITPIGGRVIAPKHERTSSRQTSQRKIEANRRNALHSTGPKTERGKRAVSRNAIKHGLLAREAVITQGRGAENLEEFEKLLVAFREDLQPVGTSEESLVEQIAVYQWRKARVLRFEVGETRKRLDNGAVSHTLQKIDEANRNVSLLQVFEAIGLFERDTADQTLSIRERFEEIQKLQSGLRTHPIGIDFLRNTLAAIKLEVQETGSLSKKSLERVVCTIGHCDNRLVIACISLMVSKDNEKGVAPKPSTAEDGDARKEFVISLLDHNSKTLEWLDEVAEKNRLLELDAQVRSLALPDDAATDKILRYETHLDRQFYRALDQLERLQRRRKGETVPPPLNVNLAGHGVIAKQSH